MSSDGEIFYMVCDACGHIEQGREPDSRTYECEECGNGAGWGMPTKAKAVQKQLDVREKERA